MPWPTNFNTGADVNSYVNLISFWRAIREREWALGSASWPRDNMGWDYGTVTSITATTLTDSGKEWQIDPMRWVSYHDDDTPWFPADYDVIINFDDLDHSRHVRARIQGHTANKLTFTGSIEDYITAGWVPSLSWLVGKKFKIIKRGGLNWGDRWPKVPNDRELWRGDLAGAVSVTIVSGSFAPAGSYVGKTFKDGPITGTIREQRSDGTLVVDWLSSSPSGAYQIMEGPTELATGTTSGVADGLWREQADFPSGEFAGADLLIYSNKLKRISVTSNTNTTIRFSKQADGYNGNGYSIVAAGGRAWPGVTPDYPYRWYGGADAPYYTFKPNDSLFSEGLSTVRMPVTSLTWSVGTIGFCEEFTHQVFDNDAWSEITEECSEADDAKAPDIWKTLRGVQLWIELQCVAFVPTGNYSGATAIPNYTPARLFQRIGAGYVGEFSATANGDGEYTFNISGIGAGEEYYFTIVMPDGDNGPSGQMSGLNPTFGGGTTGKTYKLIVAQGWTRKYPREFAHVYPRSAFIPDIDVGEFGNQFVVVPPTNDKPGMWVDRPASSAYYEADGLGFHQEIGPAFLNGIRARYRGDNWGDPAVRPHAKVEGTDGPLDSLYWRNLWLGRFNKPQQEWYDEMKVGPVAYGGRKWFRQNERAWWSAPIGNGTLITHSGTATAGTSTTLTDSTRYYIPDDAEPGDPPVMIPFWNSTENGPRFVGMMLEVTKAVNDVDGDPQTVTYHTPITAHNNLTITFASVPAFIIPATEGTAQINVPALNVNPGDAYAIREPYRRNWFKGRTITIRKPGETAAVRTATHHDANHLWFDTALPFDIDGTTTFEIDELKPGYVYSWSGSQWVEVTGTDHNGNELKPAIVTKHGRLMKGDYIGGHLFKQVYDALNELVWTKYAVPWTSRQDVDVEELNTWQPTAQLVDIGCYDISGGADSTTWYGTGEYLGDDEYGNPVYSTGLVGCYGRVTKSESDGAPPYWYCTGSLFPTNSNIGGGAAYAYGLAEGIPTTLARAVDFYAMGWINASNPDPVAEDIVSYYERNEPWNNLYRTGENHAHTTVQFDATSTGLSFRTFTKYSTGTANQDSRVISSRLGSNAPVPPVDKPMDFSFDVVDDDACPEGILCGHEISHWEHKSFGSYAANNTAIARWNVAGGFTYVT